MGGHPRPLRELRPAAETRPRGGCRWPSAGVRIVRAVDDAETVTPGNWAPAGRPVRPLAGVEVTVMTVDRAVRVDRRTRWNAMKPRPQPGPSRIPSCRRQAPARTMPLTQAAVRPSTWPVSAPPSDQVRDRAARHPAAERGAAPAGPGPRRARRRAGRPGPARSHRSARGPRSVSADPAERIVPARTGRMRCTAPGCRSRSRHPRPSSRPGPRVGDHDDDPAAADLGGVCRAPGVIVRRAEQAVQRACPRAASSNTAQLGSRAGSGCGGGRSAARAAGRAPRTRSRRRTGGRRRR